MTECYYQRRKMVTALQWNGDNFDEVTKFIAGEAQCARHGGDYSGIFSVRVPSGLWRECRRGEWLVRENIGVFDTHSNYSFQELYAGPIYPNAGMADDLGVPPQDWSNMSAGLRGQIRNAPESHL